MLNVFWSRCVHVKENKLFHRSFFGQFPGQKTQILHAAKTYTVNPEGLWLLRVIKTFVFIYVLLFIGNISEDGQGIMECAFFPGYQRRNFISSKTPKTAVILKNINA